MTTQVSTKVRLVRCPKCRQVLAELPDVSLYRCGGCSTVLEAKNRKQEASCSKSTTQEMYSAAGSGQDSVMEEKEARSSNGDSTRPPSAESSPDKDNASCHEDSDKEISEGSCLADDPCSEVQVGEDLPVDVQESLKQYDLLGHNSEGYNSKSRNGNSGWSGSTSSNEILSSGELARDAEMDVSQVCEYAKEGRDEADFVDEIENLPELEDEETMLPQDSKDRDVDKHRYIPRPKNEENSRVSSIDENGDSCGGISPVRLDSEVPKSAEQIPEVDDQADGLDPIENSDIEKDTNGSARYPVVVDSQRSLNESLASFYLTCPDDDPVDHSVTHKYGRASSIDTLGSSSLADLSSDINFKCGSMANYPQASSYYAYDGSESSYDGNDDSIPSRNRQEAGYTSTGEMLRKDEFLTNSEPDRSFWEAGSSHRPVKGGHRRPDKSTEVNGYAGGSSLRPNKQHNVSRLRPDSREPVASHRAMSPYRHDLLPPHPGFDSDKGSYSEADKVDLLRRVYELKDQLNRIQFPKVPVHRRFPQDGKFSPSYCDHLLPDREMYSSLNHHGAYHLRHDQGLGCGEGCIVSRTAFSGEAMHYRHGLGCSCLHCHPHYSAQLPCKTSCCAVHADHNFVSRAASPQHYTSSELSLWGCETAKLGTQRHDEMKRLHLKEKYHTAKKHLLPVASGVPFVACYHCFELLQLPADFLVFKRRYHQLTCNACKKILKFSLLKGTRLVPYVPDASAPPPSVAEDYNNAARSRNVEPRSQSSSCQRIEAMSYSDYGQSFGRSYSTEGEASVISSSVKQIGRNPYNRKMSSVSSSEPMEDRRMKSVLMEDHSTNGMKTVELGGPSLQKGTSEIEEVLPSANSPLHQLMGYSSPSHVMSK